MDWPEPPLISANDPQADVKKLLFQAQLDQLKADHQAQIDRDKAAYQADIDQRKADYQAVIDSQKAAAQATIDRQKADYANYFAQVQAVNSAYLEVAKGQLAASAAKADFVQKAAGAISGAYVAVLGLSFAAGKSSLPPSGIAPTVFLGLSIFLATAYLSYLTTPEPTQEEHRANIVLNQELQRNTFIRWNGAGPLRRKYLLQAAVISLGIGVLLLPVPYLTLDVNVVWQWMVLGFVATALVPLVISRLIVDAPQKNDAPQK